MDNQSIIVFRGGRSGLRGSTRRGSGRGSRNGACGASINDLTENLHQEFINFLMQKNQNHNKIENSLPSTAEVPEPAQLKNEDNFQIGRIQLRGFGEKLDQLSKTM
jgi:hypothetical protein